MGLLKREKKKSTEEKETSSVQTGSLNNHPFYQLNGYSARPPVGEEVFIIQSSDGQAVAGVRSEVQHLDSGEIRLRSKRFRRRLQANTWTDTPL